MEALCPNPQLDDSWVQSGAPYTRHRAALSLRSRQSHLLDQEPGNPSVHHPQSRAHRFKGCWRIGTAAQRAH